MPERLLSHAQHAEKLSNRGSLCLSCVVVPAKGFVSHCAVFKNLGAVVAEDE